MSLIEILWVNAGVIAAAMLLLWFVSLRLKDASIVDIFWGLGFVLIAAVTRVMLYNHRHESDQAALDSTLEGVVDFTRANVLVSLTAIWGIRLTIYLAWRNHGRGEDPRYAAMRAARGEAFWWVSLLTVFLLQGIVMWLVSLPVQVGQLNSAPLNVLAWLGIAIWLVGWLFESIGDYQLARFKLSSPPAGSVMDRGLWRYTRHPNYFGNALIWWGIFLVAVQGNSWWLALSPILMTFLLIKVSGVALLERSLSSRSEEYRQYIRRTSPFLPWPPTPLPRSDVNLEKNSRAGR